MSIVTFVKLVESNWGRLWREGLGEARLLEVGERRFSDEVKSYLAVSSGIGILVELVDRIGRENAGD